MICGNALPDMAHGAIHICSGRVSAASTTIIGVYKKRIRNMAAFALQLCTIIQFLAGMVALSAVTHRARLRAIDMNGLGILMAQAAGRPVKGHIGYVGPLI